jgi:hypothetical protein
VNVESRVARGVDMKEKVDVLFVIWFSLCSCAGVVIRSDRLIFFISEDEEVAAVERSVNS